MIMPLDQRRLLGAFLRARREATPPAPKASGGGTRLRRRTPGLRREEVAELSGISTTWYSWVEQGRDVALSPGALARLAAALRLSDAERAYLFELAQRRDPSPNHGGVAQASAPPDLVRAIEAIAAPAYLLDRMWQARAWNPTAGRLFAPWFDTQEPCILRYVFLDPGARDFILDWDDRARRLAAEFRADTAHEVNDPAIAGLVAELKRDSPLFAGLWNRHTVLSREGGLRTFNHPSDGILRFRQTTLVPSTFPDHKLVMLVPTG